MLRRISLANKCLLLFGLAVVLIVTAALSVAWVRMNVVIDEGELATARRTVLLWDTLRQRAARSSTDESATGLASERLFVEEAALSFLRADQPGLTMPLPSGPSAPPPAASPPPAPPPAASPLAAPAEPPSTVRPPGEFVRRAIAAFAANPSLTELWDVDWGLSARVYAYARPVRGLPPPAPQSGPAPASSETAAASAAPNQPGVYIYRKTSRDAASAMWLNLAFLASVGVATLGLAVLVFYLITNKIILQPVRQLRATAEDVRQGELDVRSDIQTGDEFEELAEAFNEMLAGLSQSQAQLRAINTALDEKINQLSERNNMLFEAARVKGEFLANITHELRTPLNSILGFAELLDETAARDELTARAQTAAVSAQPADGQPAAGQLSPGQTSPAQLSPEDVAAFSARIVKRRRYIDNILSAGRNLLELINSLLEMAKVEAGKVELRLKEVNPKDLCEQLAAMMRPQADKRNVELRLEVPDTQPPNLITDAGKLQQIIFNLLSNAVKFTGDMADEQRAAAAKRAYEQPESAVIVEHQHPAVVTLRLEHLITRDPETGQTHDKLRFCVLDSGPGIAPEDQRRIFDKFTQLDSGYGRKHAGTGLGLAICKELTGLLQGEISVQSELNRGSMFSVILPLARDQKLAAESRLEQVFRGQLSATKPEQPA